MTRITWNEPALDRLLNQPGGDVGRHMKSIGLKILVGASVMAGVRSGDVVRRLYMTQGRRGRLQYVEVGSKSRHAWYHHEGTKPHQIVADNGRLLRFNVGGKVVYARRVSHPGTRGTKFLTVPMGRVVR